MLRSFSNRPVRKAASAFLGVSWRGQADILKGVSLPSFTVNSTNARNSSLLSNVSESASNGSQPPAPLTPVEELAQMVAAAPSFSSPSSSSSGRGATDRNCSRHIHVAVRLVQLSLVYYKELGLPTDWPSARRKEQMSQFGLSPDVQSFQSEKEGEKSSALDGQDDGEEVEQGSTESSSVAKPTSPETTSVPLPHRLINLLNTYIRYESELLDQLDAPTLPQRLRAKKWQEDVAPYRLGPLERQYILHLVSNSVEKREIPLVIATRLLRRRWPGALMDMAGAAHHRFIVKSVFAWIAEGLQNDVLTPLDARAILDNSAFALKSSGTALVGKLAMVAIRDLHELENPEGMISLMWAVSSAGVHAPEAFWRQIFLRLVEVNRSQKGSFGSILSSGKEKKSEVMSFSFVTNTEENVDESSPKGSSSSSSSDVNTTVKKQSPKASRRVKGNHVFSGLTTRQIYRILSVLKKERWSGEAGDMHELADQALKNIVFEAEALVLSEQDANADVPKRLLAERLRSISDLSFQEFLSLLTIAGDLGVPFHISALRVSDILFVPLTRFLEQTQLLSLLLVVRQTRCYSPSLISVIAKQIRMRGPGAHYALPLAKAFMRAVTKEKSLLIQPAVVEFIHYFFGMCTNVVGKIRLSELSSLGDVVYTVYRAHAPDSSIGLKCKKMIDSFCKQVDRIMQLQLSSTAVASKMLEFTILMDMREDPERYTNVASLLQTRNAMCAATEKELHSDVSLLSSGRVPSLEDRATDESAEPGKGKKTKESPDSCLSMIDQWSALEENELPAIPKAALQVYNEIIYFFEKIAVVRSDITSIDVEKFNSIFEQTGLYNIFLGAHLMQQAHLFSTGSSKSSPSQVGLNTLPVPIQRRVQKFISSKIARLKAPSKKDVSNHELLQMLGQVHCNKEKVDKFIQMVQNSPLVLTKQHKDIWVFAKLLADRFGDESQQKKTEAFCKLSLF